MANIANTAWPSRAAEPIHPVQKYISTQAIQQVAGDRKQSNQPSLTHHATNLALTKHVENPIKPDPNSAEIKAPTPKPAPVAVVQPQPRLINKGTFKLTFYDPAVLGARSMPGGMYAGVAAHLGVIPRGSRIKITLSSGEVWYRTVNDTGTFAASNSQQLDVAMPNSAIPSAGVLSANVQIVQQA